LAYVPEGVIAKNFQTDVSAFDHIPAKAVVYLPWNPPPANVEEDKVIPNNTPEP